MALRKCKPKNVGATILRRAKVISLEACVAPPLLPLDKNFVSLQNISSRAKRDASTPEEVDDGANERGATSKTLVAKLMVMVEGGCVT